jgi:diguanylate cyclase (GGDEF)-like protein/PAS domain S-box-containing protein
MDTTQPPPMPLEEPRAAGWAGVLVPAAAVLVLSLAVSFWGWQRVARIEASRAREVSRLRFRDLERAIGGRLLTCDRILRGAAGLYAASNRVEREEWRRYVEHLRLGPDVPGIVALGVAPVAGREDREALARSRRSGRFPDLGTPPVPEPATPILFLEPATGPERALLGRDVRTGPSCRQAEDRARDNGASSLSGPLVFGPGGRAGVMMFTPFYARGTVPVGLEARRAALRGFVIGLLRLDGLLDGVCDQGPEAFDLEILDGDPAMAGSRLYSRQGDRHGDPLPRSQPLELFGRRWTVLARPKVPPEATGGLTRLILFSGTTRSVLLFAAVLGLLSARRLAVSRRRALAGARVAHAALLESHARLREAALRSKGEQEQLRLAAKVFEGCSEAICVTDAGNRILSVNPAFLQVTGYPLEELLGEDPRILSSQRQDPAFYERMWAALLAGGRWQGEIWDRRKDGEVYPKWMTIDAVRDASGAIVNFVSIASDISERHSAEANLRFQAEHDPLTGLPNRVLLADRFLQASALAAREGRRLGIMFLDMDHFKQINDTLGHGAGDRLLEEVAQRLLSGVRISDTVTRIGGDEFVVMVPGLSGEEDAMAIADKLLAAVRAPYELAGRTLSMTFSVGVALFPEHGRTLDDLLRAADAAMYIAKEGGRNRSAFHAQA